MSEFVFVGRIEIDPTASDVVIIKNPDGTTKGFVVLGADGEPTEPPPTRQQLLDDGWVEMGAVVEDDQ